MDVGICCSPKEAESLDTDAFDFIEVNAQRFLVPELEESEFLPHLEEARNTGRPVKSANCFLPGNLKCVGPGVDHDRLARYAGRVFARGSQAGIGIVVFGSGAARAMPEGYDFGRAMEDFVGALRVFGPLAQRHGITLVVEPLNSSECNFINSLAEGAQVVERCDHPNVRLLADFYHMLMEGEAASEIVRFGHLIRHTHVAELAGRAFPGKARENFRPFFQALKQCGYSGAIALECGWDDMRTDLARSVQYLRGQMAD